jgi:hypothetical protein
MPPQLQSQAYPPISQSAPQQSYGSYSQPSLLSQMLQSGQASENALASSAIPDDAIPYSKADLNAFAVGLEDQLVAQLPYLQAGSELAELINDPRRFPEFTQVYLTRMLEIPGGLDYTNNQFGPILDEANARDPRVQDYLARQQQAAYQQQAQQQQMMQQQQQHVAQHQELANAGFSWDDGGGMPLQSGNLQSQVTGMMSSRPEMGWMAVDQMAAQGQFRGKALVEF